MNGEKLLTVKEVAERLRVTRESVYGYILRGLETRRGKVYLKGFKVGTYRIPESALTEFLRVCGNTVNVDFAGEEARREKERAEARDRVRKRLKLD